MNRKHTLIVGALIIVGAIPACTASSGDSSSTDDDGGGERGDGDESPSGGSSSTGGTTAGSGGAGSGGTGLGSGGVGTGGAGSGGMGTGGTIEPECTENVDCTDTDQCTDSVCMEGECVHSDNGTCECEQPSDCVNTNVCLSFTCEDRKCVSANTTAACPDDGNECTVDVCGAGECTHPAGEENTACSADDNECTLDVCRSGLCAHPAGEDGVACADDAEVCTYDVCQAGECEHSGLSGTACSDGDLCTDDECVEGACTGTGNNLCQVTTVAIRSRRSNPANLNQWLVFDDNDDIVWSENNAGAEGAVFAKEDLGDGTFKLRRLADDLYLTVKYPDAGPQDRLRASATLETAGIFQTSDCGFGGVGIVTLTDTSGNGYWKAEGNLTVISYEGGCPIANSAAWERFEIVEVPDPGMGGSPGL